MRIAPVAALLPAGCPPAVGWLVVAIVVDPFEGQTGGTRPHVPEKRLERLPSIADPDSPCAVVVPSGGPRIPAAGQHCGPPAVLGAAPSSRLAVAHHKQVRILPRTLRRETPAAPRGATVKRCGPHGTFHPAVASAYPSGFPRMGAVPSRVGREIGCAAHRHETPEALSSEIEGHRCLYTRTEPWEVRCS